MRNGPRMLMFGGNIMNERAYTQITIKPGIFSLAIAATVGFVLGQTTVYVKAAKTILKEDKDDEN